MRMERHHIAVRPLSPHLSYSSFSPTSWVLYGKGEGVVEFRDKGVSLLQVILDKWAVLTLSAIEVTSGILIYKMRLVEKIFVSDNAAQDRLVVGIGYVLLILWIAWGALFIILVQMRWWTPSSIVRISGGMMSIDRPMGMKRGLREFKVTDITSVQTSVGNPKFHSFFFTHGVWLRDGKKVTFLSCRNRPEAKWVLELMQEAIAAATDTENRLSLATGAAASTLDAPPLTTKTAPPAPPDSQSASISNQNTA
jgi:hypothetical protein